MRRIGFLVFLLLIVVMVQVVLPVSASDEKFVPVAVEIANPGRDSLKGFMVMPGRGYYPAVLFAQGSGVKAADTVRTLQFFASRGYVALAVDYHCSAAPPTDLITAVRFLKSNQHVQKNRVSIVGFSMGARYGVMTGQFEPLYAVVAIGGRYIVRPDNISQANQSPITYVEKMQCPVLLMHVRWDPVVPSENSVEMEKALRRAFKKVTFKMYEGDTHWPGDPGVMEEVMKFIR